MIFCKIYFNCMMSQFPIVISCFCYDSFVMWTYVTGNVSLHLDIRSWVLRWTIDGLKAYYLTWAMYFISISSIKAHIFALVHCTQGIKWAFINSVDLKYSLPKSKCLYHNSWTCSWHYALPKNQWFYMISGNANVDLYRCNICSLITICCLGLVRSKETNWR